MEAYGKEIALFCECGNRTEIKTLVQMDNGVLALYCACQTCNDSGFVPLDDAFRQGLHGVCQNGGEDPGDFDLATEEELINKLGIQ